MKIRKHLDSYVKSSYVNDNEIIEGEFIDCSLGTNPLGCSDTLSSISISPKKMVSYPDTTYLDLKNAIAEYWRDVAVLKPENIKMGNGSISVLEKLNRLFIDVGDSVLGYAPQFTDYGTDVECCGGIYEYVALDPKVNRRFKCEDYLAALDKKYKIAYLDNPNNPTGQILPISDLDKIVSRANELGVFVIVDEAYGDFMNKEQSAVSLVNKYDNLSVVRTFSKGFGLAGIRAGYIVASASFIALYSRVDTPFTVNTCGHMLALGAIKDDGFIKRSRSEIKEAKGKIIGSLKNIKVMHTDMEVPIMTLSSPDKGMDLFGEFKKRGVLTESCSEFKTMDKSSIRLRTTVSRVDDLIKVIKDIEKLF